MQPALRFLRVLLFKPRMPDLSSFHFLRPGWLWLLPVAGVLIWLITRRGDAQRTWRNIIAPQLLEALLVKGGQSGRLRPVPVLATVFAVSIVALAGPAWRHEPSPFTEDKAALVIALKVTPSMLTSDLQPSRLERSVYKIRDVLARRPGTRTALIAYAGSAHLVMPLTRDAEIINSFARELRPELMPREGDDPAAALALARRQLQEAKQSGSVLLIADGVAATEATQIAQQRKSDATRLVLLGAVGFDTESPEHRELKQAASTLGAALEFISPDDRDATAITAQVERSLSSVADAEGGTRWRDEGYWLTPLLCVLALFWFRPGWVVRYT